MKSLPTRILSAAIALIIIGVLFFTLRDLGLAVLCFIASFIGAYEFYGLSKPQAKMWHQIVYATVQVFLCYLITNPAWTVAAFIASVVLTMVAVILANRKESNIHLILQDILRAVFALLYVVLFPALAAQIALSKGGIFWFTYLLVVVFAGDIFAFFFGVLWGKEKIMPYLSPNKTIMGSIGGIVGSLTASLILVQIYELQHNLWPYVLGSVVIAVCAQCGDFFESLLKRISNVKDSGRIMPGHGGLLDRIDGVLFAVPIVYVLALFA